MNNQNKTLYALRKNFPSSSVYTNQVKYFIHFHTSSSINIVWSQSFWFWNVLSIILFLLYELLDVSLLRPTGQLIWTPDVRFLSRTQMA